MKTLNNILTEYEHFIKAEAELELPVLDKLVALGDISDYEYEATVSYYIDKKMLVKEFDESLKSLNADSGMIADGADHSDGCAQTRGKFRHCYLFHCLCDHHHVCREDLPEINRVRLDFVCTRQMLYELKKAPLYFPKINEELLKMERWIKGGMASGTEWIRNKLKAEGIFLPSWDLKCSVSFHLSERSWHYKEKEDNDYATLKIDDLSLLNDGNDHNKHSIPSGHAFNTHSQCWLMSELVSQLSGKGGLTLEYIEDTGMVWIDIDISYGMQREV